MKNLSIFEPQIEKHYAYKKHVIDSQHDSVNHLLRTQTNVKLYLCEIVKTL